MPMSTPYSADFRIRLITILIGAITPNVCLAAGGQETSGLNIKSSEGLYCNHEYGNDNILGLRKIGRDDMLIGLSIWNVKKNNITIYGLARRRGDHWQFREGMDSADIRDHCIVDVYIKKDIDIAIYSHKTDRCENDGGYGTQIGYLKFSRADKKGPIRMSIRDPESFMRAEPRC